MGLTTWPSVQPLDPVSDRDDAGSVAVLYGSEQGLQELPPPTNGFDLWTALSFGHVAERNGHFGRALASGDFDGDGMDDLAIGAPGMDEQDSRENPNGAGVVFIAYGSSEGLILKNGRRSEITESANDILGCSEGGERFGHALAAGDFNGDGKDDLAVGVPGQDRRVRGVTKVDAGAVHFFHGASSSSIFKGDTVLHQESRGVDEQAEQFDMFGFTLATGDINGDGYDDLAVGVPLEDLRFIGPDAGAVHVFFGSRFQLNHRISERPLSFFQRAELLEQNDLGVIIERDAFFGFAVAFADIDPIIGGDELIVGVPFKDINGFRDAGMVHTYSITSFSGQRVVLENTTTEQELQSLTGEDHHFGFSIGVVKPSQ